MKKIYALLMFIIPLMGYAQNIHVVTFKVNTANITVGPNGLFLGGGIIGGANEVQLLDPDGNGIYEGTDSLSGVVGGNFIFLNSPSNNSDWGTKEVLSGLPCSDPANYNDRILPSFTQDTTLLFCFGTCATDTICPAPPIQRSIHFKVDMNSPFAPTSFSQPYLSGSFNGWSGNSWAMTDNDSDNVWEYTAMLDENVVYEYKFSLDNWAGQEQFSSSTSDSICTQNFGGYVNRVYTVGSSDDTIMYCYNSCNVNCGLVTPPPTPHVVTFKVSAANINVGPNGLYLGGGVIGGATEVLLTDPDGNGVYEGTDTLSGAGGGNFIFLNSPANSSDWDTKEILQGLPCSDPNNWDDRILPSFTQDTTLLFCFGTCATDTICPAPWVSTGPLSGVYTINANSFGARNYTSFASAVADLDSLGVIGAVTFNVASGIYDEQVNLGQVTGASSINTITFFGDVGNALSPTVLTYTPLGSSDNWTVKMTGTDYITFDNMTITSGGSSYGRLIMYTDTVTDFNLTNCHLIGRTSSGGSTSSFYAGLYYEYPAVAAGNWHISDNTFDSVSYAIYVYGLGYGAGQGADSVFVEDNTINANYNGFYVRYAKYQKMHDNVINDINGGSLRNYAYYPVYELDVQNNQVNDAAYGIYMYTAPPTSGATGGIKVNISNNHFEGTLYGIRVGGSGTSTTEKITDLTIENNTIEAWGSSYNYGIYLAYIQAPGGTDRATVQNNMIALNTTSTTGTLYGIYPYHCANVDMFHNSIAANGGSLTNSRLLYLNHSSSTSYCSAGGNNAFNNAFVNYNGGKCVVAQTATTGLPSYMFVNNNLHFTTNTSPHTNFTPAASSVFGDPMYVNPLTDLHARTQVADNAGTPVGVLTDIDGDTRSTTTPDIGADEYTYVPICFAPTGVIGSNVTASSFDASWSSANTAIGYHARAWATGTTAYTYSSGTSGPASFTGLLANTSYSVEVREICAVGDTSGWSNAGTVTTLCSSILVTEATPFVENFDGSNWSPNTAGYDSGTWDNCWTPEPPLTSGTYTWQVQSGGTPSSNTGPLAANSGLNYIYHEASFGGNGDSTIVKTPSFNLSLNNPELSFAYHMFGALQDAIYIDISTNSGVSFVTIDTVTATMVNQSDPWALHFTDLSNYANTTVILAFRVMKGTSWTKDAAIDDFSIAKKITCFPASNLNSFNETVTSFEGSWTPGNTSAIGHQVRYAINDGNANWSYLYGTGSSVSIVGLAPGTQYEWNVREICAIGDTAEWSTPVAANTKFCSPSFECSVTAKLHDSYGDGWNGGEIAIEQKNTSGQWVPVEFFGTNFTSSAGSPAGDTILEYGNVCAGDSFRVVGTQAGSYSQEMGWLMTNAEGDTLDYRQGNNSGPTWSSGTVFGTGVGNCNLDKCLAIQVAPAPSVPTISICGPQNVILTNQLSNPNFELLWMKNQNKNSGPRVVHTGSSYDLGLVSRFKEFLVQYYVKNDTLQGYNVGPSSSLFGGFSNSNNGTWFSVQSPLRIDSITVKSNGAIDFKVNISSASGNITSGNQGGLLQQSGLITLTSAGTHKVYVGLVILPGEYFMNMDFTHGSAGQLYRAVTGASYPYTSGNISIDSVDYSNQNYAAYAYDWIVSEGCMGPSSSVSVIVNSEVDTTLSFDGPLDFCAGGSVTMTAASRPSMVVSIDSSLRVIEPTVHVGEYPNAIANTAFNWGTSVSASVTDTMVLMNDGSSGMNTDYGYSFAQSLCGCDSTGVLNNQDIQGKVVLISRGTCEFGWKVYLAQLAGASGVVIYNAYPDAAPGQYAGGVWNMGPGSYGSLATIPTVFVANSTGKIFKNELEASAGYSYLWSTGDTTQSITVNQAGDYYATLTTLYGLCSETTATYSTSILSDPNVTVVADGPLAFCSGDTLNLSGVTSTADSLVGPIPGGNGSAGNMFNVVNTSGAPLSITGFAQGPGSVNSSQSNVTVQVYYSPGDYTTQPTSSWVAAGSAVTNLTASASTGYVPVAVTIPAGATYGFYVGVTSGSVQYTNGTGTAGVSTWFSNNDMTVTEGLGGSYPSPTFSPRCWNGTIYYSSNSSASGQSYLWSNGDTTQTTSITQAGSYYAVVTSSNGCIDTTDTYTASVFAAPDTTVTPSGSLDFCSDDDVTLTAAAGQSYLWSTGDTTQSITVNQAGSYSAMITTSDGCSEMTATYTTTVFADADTSVTVSGSLDFCSYEDVTLTAAPGQSYLWSNGATTQSITVNQAGSYYAVVTTSNGCSDTTDTYTTSVFADPDINITTSGSLDFCSYEDVVLTAASGQTYSWSTGETTQSITVDQAGSYHAIITTSDGCVDTTSNFTTTIFADADISVTTSGSLDFCSYDDVTITAAAGQSYVWSTGDTSQSITTNQVGSYSFTATTLNGCIDTSAVYTTSIFADPDTSVVVTQTLFCASDSAVLIAAPGQSYLWSNGDSTQATIVNTSGNYYVTTTTNDGCEGNSDTTSITVVPDIIVPQIVANGLGWVATGSSTTFTITLDSTQTYQWNIEGGTIISGQGTDSLVVNWGIPDTNVTVWLVISNGVCSDSTSVSFTISGIGFEEDLMSGAKLYPNPNGGQFTVFIPEEYIGSEMVVIDGVGRVIERLIVQDSRTNIDVRDKPKGVYRVQIKSKLGIKTMPVVIQ